MNLTNARQEIQLAIDTDTTASAICTMINRLRDNGYIAPKFALMLLDILVSGRASNQAVLTTLLNAIKP